MGEACYCSFRYLCYCLLFVIVLSAHKAREGKYLYILHNHLPSMCIMKTVCSRRYLHPEPAFLKTYSAEEALELPGEVDCLEGFASSNMNKL